MDTRTKELIAIGASVPANCLPCLQFHVKKAQQEGVTDGEIRTAVRIGQLVRRGAATTWDDKAMPLIGAAATATAAGSGTDTESGCGCT